MQPRIILPLSDAPRLLAQLAQSIEFVLATPILVNLTFMATVTDEEKDSILKIALDLKLNAHIHYMEFIEKPHPSSPISYKKWAPILLIMAHSLEIGPIDPQQVAPELKIQPEDISSKPLLQMPEWYRCCHCKGTHRRLYTYKDDESIHMLECAPCAAKSSHIEIQRMLPNGRHFREHENFTLCIGDYHPAIPMLDGSDIIWREKPSEALWLWWEALPDGLALA